MTRLQTIENALATINPAAFQELCDAFLALRNRNYSAFSRTGSQLGKQKSIKGTPDSFFLLPDGTYIFVEHSTNETSGTKKLGEDIQKCLDTTKTGIDTDLIREIILCTNFKVTPEEVNVLKSTLKDTIIQLTIYTLDTLAIELNFQHNNLVRDYLGVAIDTGQVVSINRFIEEYNKASQSIATPLDNSFLHRENELTELKTLLDTKDFIIITGSAGVGKTKLCLETINSFLADNPTYKAFCISYKNHTLIDDLYAHLANDGDYLLFVDDANRIDRFSQITGFYTNQRTGKLKIIVTVRDYAFTQIDIFCKNLSPATINIQKFSDDHIRDIISSDSFKILNPSYQNEIIRIADGNPRIAIMSSLLARKTESLDSLRNVGELFDLYFSTFVKDKDEFAKPITFKVLGLLAFFGALPIKDKKFLEPILTDFSISYQDFFEQIEILDRLEIVDIQFDYLKIPEQNLSTFFFFKAFIKDEVLSFDMLLKSYFFKNAERFKDTVIPANNNFGANDVMNKLQPKLKQFLAENNDPNNKFKLLEEFWFYLIDETFGHLYQLINSTPYSESHGVFNYNEDDKQRFGNKNPILELLKEFYRFHHAKELETALGLSFELVTRQTELFQELLENIISWMKFDVDDSYDGFHRQKLLVDFLIKNLSNSNQIYRKAFIELSKKFLKHKFEHSKSGRNNTINIYHYPIPNNENIQTIRTKFWETLAILYMEYSSEIFEVLKIHSRIGPDTDDGIMNFDFNFIANIIEANLDPSNFLNCKYVQDQIAWWKRHNIQNQTINTLKAKFTNNLYSEYLVLDWNRYRDKEDYEFDDYREYEKLKEADIRSAFVFKNEVEVEQFYKNFKVIKSNIKDAWSLNGSFDIVLDETLKENYTLGLFLLRLILKEPGIGQFNLGRTFYNNLSKESIIKDIWSEIQESSIDNKWEWEIQLYGRLSEQNCYLISEEQILKSLNAINSRCNSFLGRNFKNFNTLYPALYQKMFEIVYEKNAQDIGVEIWADDFLDVLDYVALQVLEKSYLQQHKIQQHFDYNAETLKAILKKNKSFLLTLVEATVEKEIGTFKEEYRNLGFVWEMPDIVGEIRAIADFFAQNTSFFGISEHGLNSFFKGLASEHVIVAEKFLLDYLQENSNDSTKVNMVIDVIRHSRHELLPDALLSYLKLNHDKDSFSEIWWRGNGGITSGDQNPGDIEANDWRRIAEIVGTSDVGIALIPIKKYISEMIDYALERAENHRKRRFLRADW